MSQKVINNNCLFVLDQNFEKVYYRLDPSYHDKVFNHVSGHFYHICSCYVQHSLNIISNDLCIVPNHLEFIHEVSKGYVTAQYENVIATGHLYTIYFGHFLSDFICPILAMPDDIIQKSYILGSAEKRLVDEYLTPLGLREKFINVSDNEWVYTSNLYITANPYPHCSHLGPLYKKLGDKLKNYFNISNLPARRYILSNRKSYMRQIHNFDNLSKAIQDAFPSINTKKLLMSV